MNARDYAVQFGKDHLEFTKASNAIYLKGDQTVYRWDDWRNHRDDFLADVPADMRGEVEALINEHRENA